MNNQSIKIEIDLGACIGAATCVALLEEVFELSPDGRAKLKKGDHLSDYEQATVDKLVEAAKSCPTLAIKVTDESQGKVIYPL